MAYIKPTEKEILKYLRDKLVEEIDRAGIEVLNHSLPSSGDAMTLAFNAYHSAIFDRVVSLDILVDMDKSK